MMLSESLGFKWSNVLYGYALRYSFWASENLQASSGKLFWPWSFCRQRPCRVIVFTRYGPRQQHDDGEKSPIVIFDPFVSVAQNRNPIRCLSYKWIGILFSTLDSIGNKIIFREFDSRSILFHGIFKRDGIATRPSTRSEIESISVNLILDPFVSMAPNRRHFS